MTGDEIIIQKRRRLIMLISTSEAGGAQVYIVNLVKAINDIYNITVICPDGYMKDRLLENNIEVVTSGISVKDIISLRAYLKKEIVNNENIVINTHLLGTTFWTLLSISFLTNKCRFISTLHQPIIYDKISKLKKMCFPSIAKFVSKRTDEFIVVSKEIKDSILQYTNRTAYYIPNSVPDIKDKRKIDIPLKEKQLLKVGIVGRLTHQKGHQYFLDAAKLIRDTIFNSNFYIIGDGELRGQLEEQTKKLKLQKNVTFTGFLTNPIQIIREMDIIVFSSVFEGTPLAMLETMSIGVPVVATAVGGIPQVLQNKVNGILVKPLDAKEIYNAVICLFEDFELYKAISKKSIETMQTTYNYIRNISIYKRIINGVDE
ncbi:MAG: hypothetical protein CVV03_07985 [Firmicutes bacterium HGW-Firmicutes-8]|nr:MAG: hypothetical protein CVV03_07985 [Firmicutes bacterium HGW-Firmicutes-8]